LAVLGNVSVEVRASFRPIGGMETTRRRGEGPGNRTLSALCRAAIDADVVHREARSGRLAWLALLRHVGPIAEAEPNGLAVIGREVCRQVYPVRGDTGDAFALVLAVRAGVGGEIGMDIRPVRAAICRDFEIGVVPILL